MAKEKNNSKMTKEELSDMKKRKKNLPKRMTALVVSIVMQR